MKLVYKYQTLVLELENNNNQVRLLPITLNDLFWLKKGDASYHDVTHVVPDGMPVVLYLKCMGYKAERLYGPDLFLQLIKSNPQKKHLFLGSQFMLDKLKKKLAIKHGLYIGLGFEDHGSKLITESIVQKIKKFQPNFIWIGVSSPKQLQVMSKIQSFYMGGSIFCVGAALPFAIDSSLRAPDFMKKISLEWLFRLIKEPKRLWKRYLFYSPVGLFFLPNFIKNVNIK